MKRFTISRLYTFVMAVFITAAAGAQTKQHWVDSVFASLSPDERIAQLMVIRTSGMDQNGDAVFYDQQTFKLVKDYNIGAVCLFQGTPEQQAELLNRMQAMAKTPVMVTVDGEWGLGMRFKGVESFPYQLTLGAMPDASIVYEVGKAIAEQCRRMNIHVNYAPVVDINNNPANPVIGVRSFGEDKYKVALMGTRIMEGMQDYGVMACAKHFPGHGDVSVDSHYDLPVINKSISELNALELYPFKEIFSKGVGSVMVAHLYIPAIDNTANRATSLSPRNVTGLLRNDLGYTGLTFTDALEMKGVAKFFPSGEAAVQSIIAGNDMLCLPADVPQTIVEINKAIADGRLTRSAVDEKCRRVLEAKYDYVLGKTNAINTSNLPGDLNVNVAPLRDKVARAAFTLVKQDNPELRNSTAPGTYVMMSSAKDYDLEKWLQSKGWKVEWINPRSAISDEEANAILARTAMKGRKVIGLHSLNRSPVNNFGIDATAIALLNRMAEKSGEAEVVVFGNPYALGTFHAEKFSTVAVAYEDDAIFRKAGAAWLTGGLQPGGVLPVSVGAFQFGQGVVAPHRLPFTAPDAEELKSEVLKQIDTIALEGIAEKAYPGCVVTVVKSGKVAFQKAYGNTDYRGDQPMNADLLFDLASVTKTSATTLAVMQLWEQGKLKLNEKIGNYLPWLIGSGKENLTVENLLLHQAGLVSWIPFYRNVIDANGSPDRQWFRAAKTGAYQLEVSNNLYMHYAYTDTMYAAIAASELVKDKVAYVYSDNDFILLADIVKAISGKRIDVYMHDNFYEPLGLKRTGFQPYKHFALNTIVPTEDEAVFRKSLIWGYVHDPGAAMFGNVAGHAGLFSNANELAILYQMLLNGGEYNGRRYVQPSTIQYFTRYQTPVSRRGLGWDKPSKNNVSAPTSNDAYPASLLSLKSFGHTGFTGTCVWADPENDLIYIFLSNRVHPEGGDNRKLLSLNIRGRIHDVIYKSIQSQKN